MICHPYRRPTAHELAKHCNAYTVMGFSMGCVKELLKSDRSGVITPTTLPSLEYSELIALPGIGDNYAREITQVLRSRIERLFGEVRA